MLCLNCNSNTNNPKFCSRSCAATFNNKVKPKRKLTKLCKSCNKTIKYSSTYCIKCLYEHKNFITDNTTIQDLIDRGYNDHNRYSLIRLRARKAMKDFVKECSVCGYSLCVHVCHIKPISSYPKDTKLREVNDIKNLIFLCPNHHWEFDNGFIDLN